MTTTDSSQQQVQDAAAQAKDKAAEAAGQAQVKARDQVRTQVDERSTQAGQQVSTQAADVRSVADALREQGKDQPAKLADRAADHAENLGSWLEHSDADKILSDLEDFGRRQPMAVVFGGLALGFAASRFLKASSQERSQTRAQAPPQLPARTPTRGAGAPVPMPPAPATPGATPAATPGAR